ncbi:MAG TPA: hypothetical protein ENF82_02420 [Candidatus Methanomethylia archaeon]|nr:hypothetical protein [Candidatus Verstraetearchaeota archaeon]HDI46641.1 hypothetical protein [Candidatus Methanomethylicia archaeon]
MKPPCEIVVKSLLPALRALIARELASKYGWNQMKIAKYIGVTQAAVSGYLSAKISDIVTPPFSIEELSAVAKAMAAEIASKKLTYMDLVGNICKVCLGMRRGGALCRAHKEKVPELDEENCSICMNLHLSLADISDARRMVLSELREAVSLLEGSPEFAIVVPEVFTNIAMATNGAKTIADVAAIPGRIAKVRGRVRAFMEPEFGVSQHLAGILLEVMKRDPKVKAIMNIKFDSDVEMALRKMNIRFVKMRRKELPKEAFEAEDPVAWFAGYITKRLGKAPNVIIDEGEHGIEPATYILGESAKKIAELAVRIARVAAKLKAASMLTY